jgi:hypothetical protein
MRRKFVFEGPMIGGFPNRMVVLGTVTRFDRIWANGVLYSPEHHWPVEMDDHTVLIEDWAAKRDRAIQR